MGLKNDVLTYLCKKQDSFVSGEELALEFGKSRAAVWKAVKSLQSEGYLIDAQTNKGYRLSAENDVLNAQEIEKYIDFDCKVCYYETLDSTNTQAKRLINEGENGVMLVVGGEQTEGRGRQGKSFYSPAKTGVYLSLVIHPMSRLQDAVTATTAAAVAVCRAVEDLTDKKPGIKWVNDVYLEGRKICGILTEAVTDFETQTVTSVIVGIGINVSTESFPDDVENASCLNVNVSRARLVAAVANELNHIVNSSYEDYIDYYRSRSIIIGEDIDVVINGEHTYARALGIDNQGGLEIQLSDGTLNTLHSGEISIRKIKKL